MMFIYYHIYSCMYSIITDIMFHRIATVRNKIEENIILTKKHGVFRVSALLELILTGCYFYSMCIMPVSAFPNSPIRYLQHNMSLFVARLNVVRNLCKVFFLLFYLLKSQMRVESKSVLSDVEYRSR